MNVQTSEVQAAYGTAPPIGPDELPPPYSPSPHGVPMIACKVCGFMIDITEKRNQYVVKCSSCNEATPIKNAPPGKKYIRCSCNCLVICDAKSKNVTCPRDSCKRNINLTSAQATVSSNLTTTNSLSSPSTVAPHLPGMWQVSCAYCQGLFAFNITKANLLARCPNCGKLSSIGKYSRRRGILYMIGAFIMLILGIGVTVGTLVNASRNGGVYYVYIGAFILSFVWFCYSICYFRMKTSTIAGPV